MSSGPEDQPGAGWQPPPAPPGSYDQPPGWPPPPAPPGPYGQANVGWPQMAGRGTNPLAIASLCCAIGQVIAGPIAGIAAIVLGVMSMKQIEVSGEDGRGMAMTGLVLGIVGTILFVLVLIFVAAIVGGILSHVSN
jgi:Domain of unknown function (DUF4190)